MIFYSRFVPFLTLGTVKDQEKNGIESDYVINTDHGHLLSSTIYFITLERMQ